MTTTPDTTVTDWTITPDRLIRIDLTDGTTIHCGWDGSKSWEINARSDDGQDLGQWSLQPDDAPSRGDLWEWVEVAARETGLFTAEEA